MTLSPKANSLKNRLIKNSTESKKIVEDDKVLLSELLQGGNKNCFQHLISYFQGDFPISKLLQDSNTLNELLFGDYFRFFTLDSTTMGKKQIHNNEALMFSSEFSCKFANEKHSFGNYKVKVDLTRSVKTPSKSLKKTFIDLGLDLESIVDLEFFEYRHEEENLNFTELNIETISDLSQKYGIIVDGNESPAYLINKIIYSQPNLDYKDEKTLLEMINFHTDKEKLHLQFGVYVANKIKKILPLYVGIGTNEPYGVKFKGNTQKERFFIMDLLTNNIQIEHITNSKLFNLYDFFTYIKFNKNYSLTYDVDSYEYLENGNHSITFNLVDTDSKRFIKFYNIEIKIIDNNIQLGIMDLLDNICNGLQTIQFSNPQGSFDDNSSLSFQINDKNSVVATLFTNNIFIKSIYKITVSEISVTTKSFKINQIDQIKKMIQPNWSNISFLLDLLNKTDRFYSKYFRLKYNPHKIVADLDYPKTINHLNKSKGNFYNHITDSQGDLQYSNFAQMGEDLEQISGLDNRMKYINLLFGSFLANGDLDSIVLDPESFVESHKLLRN